MNKFEENTCIRKYPINKEIYVEVFEVNYLNSMDEEYINLPINTANFYKKIDDLEIFLGKIDYFHSMKCLQFNDAFELFDEYSMDSSSAILKYNYIKNIKNEDSLIYPEDVYIEKILIENSEKNKGYGKMIIRWLENHTNSDNIFLELPKVSLNWTDDNYKTLSDFYKKSFTLDLISLKDNLMVFGFLYDED